MLREREKEKARRRRNDKFRMREKARQYAKHVYGFSEREYAYYGSILFRGKVGETREAHIQELVDNEVRRAETRPRCSCTMCGNPRRHFKARTRVELKVAFDAEVQLEESGVRIEQAKRLYQRILRRRLSW